MEKANTSYVSAAKPKIAGGIYRAPIGTTLPTDAVTELDKAFENLGYVSDDGITNGTDKDTDTEKAWGGATVNEIDNGDTDTFQYKLLETLNVAAMKDAFGDDNVAGTLETGITVKKNSKEKTFHSYVIDMILKGGVLKRVVIPKARMTDIDDIVYATSESTGYNLTITAEEDEDENTHYEYLKKPTASVTPTEGK